MVTDDGSQKSCWASLIYQYLVKTADRWCGIHIVSMMMKLHQKIWFFFSCLFAVSHGQCQIFSGTTSNISGSIKGITAASSLTTELTTASQLKTAMKRISNDLGVKWLRVQFAWSEIQGAGPSSYKLTNHDRVVALAAKYNISVVGLITYCPPWANNNNNGNNQDQFYPPTHLQNYATFASYLASRYAPSGVHHWEIWYAPNLGGVFWKPTANPATYTKLLKLAYAAIKKADSKATVLLGGLVPSGDQSPVISPQKFLVAVYKNGGKRYFDAVVHHPYTYPSLPNATDGSAYWWTQMYSGTNNLRSTMTANGDTGKKIWMIYGAPTNGGGGSVTEAVQAQMVTVAYKLAANYSWAGPLFWDTYQDSGTDGTSQWDWFGLVRYDGTAKPAFAAYKAVQGECQTSVQANNTSSSSGTATRKGMNSLLTSLTPSELETTMQRLKVLGVKWIRLQFAWSEIQWAGPDYYEIANHDRAVAAAVKYNISVLGLIDYCPSWANGRSDNDQFYPPTNLQDFATFASYLVNRYTASGVYHWEIWNEPNLGGYFWKPAADPVAYTTLLQYAYTAIKTSNPKATVILGGLAPTGDEPPFLLAQKFLAAVYSNGGKGYFDAVGHHPYTYPALANATDGSAYWWTQMYSGLNNLRSIMMANGDGDKKIWMTEYGAPTNGGDGTVTEEMQAQMVTIAYTLNANYSWAGPLFWYDLEDSGTDVTNPEDWFGLIRFDKSFKPGFEAYRTV